MGIVLVGRGALRLGAEQFGTGDHLPDQLPGRFLRPRHLGRIGLHRRHGSGRRVVIAAACLGGGGLPRCPAVGIPVRLLPRTTRCQHYRRHRSPHRTPKSQRRVPHRSAPRGSCPRAWPAWPPTACNSAPSMHCGGVPTPPGPGILAVGRWGLRRVSTSLPATGRKRAGHGAGRRARGCGAGTPASCGRQP